MNIAMITDILINNLHAVNCLYYMSIPCYKINQSNKILSH